MDDFIRRSLPAANSQPAHQAPRNADRRVEQQGILADEAAFAALKPMGKCRATQISGSPVEMRASEGKRPLKQMRTGIMPVAQSGLDVTQGPFERLFVQHPGIAQEILVNLVSLAVSGLGQPLNAQSLQQVSQKLGLFKALYLAQPTPEDYQPILAHIDNLVAESHSIHEILTHNNGSVNALEKLLSTVARFLSRTTALSERGLQDLFDFCDVFVQDLQPSLERDDLDTALSRQRALLALGAAARIYSQIDWTDASFGVFFHRAHGYTQTETLAKLVSFKTALGDRRHVFEEYIPRINRLTRQMTLQNPDQAPAVPAGGAAAAHQPDGDARNLDLPIARPAPLRGENVVPQAQAKMRCLIAAAYALIRMGSADQRAEGLSKLDAAMQVFHLSKAQAYRGHHAQGLRLAQILTVDNCVQRADTQDDLLCNILAAQTVAGEGERALGLLTQEFKELPRYCKVLVMFSQALAKTAAFHWAPALATFFEKPYAALIARLEDAHLENAEKTRLFALVASQLKGMGLGALSETTFSKSVASCQSALAALEEGAVNNVSDERFSNTVQLAKTLMRNLEQHDHSELFQPVLENCPLAFKPYLLVHAADLELGGLCYDRWPLKSAAACSLWMRALQSLRDIETAVEQGVISTARKTQAVSTLKDRWYENFRSVSAATDLLGPWRQSSHYKRLARKAAKLQNSRN